MSLRIAHLTSAHPALDIRIFHKECHSLVQAGYDVFLVAPHPCSEVVSRIRIEGIRKSRFRIPRMTLTVASVLGKALSLNADLYHFHDPELIPVGLLLRGLGRRVIYDVHEDLPRDILAKAYLPGWSRGLVSRIMERFEAFAGRRFSGLITVTPTIQQRLLNYNQNTALVRNFPRIDEFPISTRPWEQRLPAVAYVGVIHPKRGICEMVHAMGKLPSSLNARLMLARNDFPIQLQNQLTRDPGWSSVEDRGQLGRSEIAMLLSQVRAGLLLFHPEPNHVPALPHKLFEYMAAGVPIIASDFPAWREIIVSQRCGLIVDPLDPAAISKAIGFVLTHSAEAEEMGLRGRKAAETLFNWESEQQHLLNFYRDLEQPVSAERPLASDNPGHYSQPDPSHLG